MNKRQLEVLKRQIRNEKEVIRLLKRIYQQASRDCEARIRELAGRTDMQDLESVIYQKQYQEALKKQLDGILDALQNEEFGDIAAYLTKCYEDGFLGTLYDLHGQGVPFLFPIDQRQVVKAVQTDSKLSTNLYKRLGEDTEYLKRSIRAELSRGIANGSTWLEIASHIANGMNSPFHKAMNNAMRIARTEGHRIQNEAQWDTLNKAKEKGADVVKQWISTLDNRTRESHRILDGQIRELEEYFEVNGHKALRPGAFGVASEDIHCRCAMGQRAKRVLGEDELKTLKERAEYFGIDKAKDFEDFSKKYLKAQAEYVAKQSGFGIIIPKKLYEGIPRNWKELGVPDDSLKVVNPHYNLTDKRYNTNCANCVSAFEMRRRGYNVVAKPMGKNHHLMHCPEDAWKEPKIEKTIGSGLEEILKSFEKWPNKSRAEVAVTWKYGNSGHVFVAEKIDGAVHFYDVQSGTMYSKSVFKRVKDGETKFWRIDDLEPSDRGITACEVGDQK